MTNRARREESSSMEVSLSTAVYSKARERAITKARWICLRADGMINSSAFATIDEFTGREGESKSDSRAGFALF